MAVLAVLVSEWSASRLRGKGRDAINHRLSHRAMQPDGLCCKSRERVWVQGPGVAARWLRGGYKNEELPTALPLDRARALAQEALKRNESCPRAYKLFGASGIYC
jgi:hypothetical protein